MSFASSDSAPQYIACSVLVMGSPAVNSAAYRLLSGRLDCLHDVFPLWFVHRLQVERPKCLRQFERVAYGSFPSRLETS